MFSNNNNIFPCKGCVNREVGCHCWCEKYKAAKEYSKKWNAKIRKERRKNYQFKDYYCCSMSRWAKRK